MSRKLFVISITIILLLVMFTPALAITYGDPDSPDPHSFVGSLVLENIQGDLIQWCSGTLISDKVFLLASHCTANLDFYVEMYGVQVWVTFDPTIIKVSEGGTLYSGVWHTNPNYNGFQGQYGSSNPGDVAVIVLNKSPGITPATLPKAGLLDELKAEHILKDTIFTAVGYGSVRETNRKSSQTIIWDNMDRRRVDQEFLSLTGSWLTLSMNLATDNGGTCYGDSGGPHFIHRDGVETNIVASITVTGDAPCKATDKTYRMDTESARSFLSTYVTLP